jgi:hypothetical protein
MSQEVGGSQGSYSPSAEAGLKGGSCGKMGIESRIADFPGTEKFPVYDPWDGALLSISPELAVTDGKNFPFFVIYGKF